MLTFEQAKLFVLETLSENTTQNPMEDWMINSDLCCEYEDYYYITGNSRGFLQYNDPAYCLVGSNGYLVNKSTHQIICLNNAMSPEQYIIDTQDEYNAKGYYYVLEYLLPENTDDKKNDLLKLKRLFSCNYTQAQKLQKHSQWLSTRLSALQYIQGELTEYNISTRIILQHQLADYTMYWQYYCGVCDMPQFSEFIHDMKERL